MVGVTAAAAGADSAQDKPGWPRVSERTREFASRVFISSLFVMLAINLGSEFLRTGHLTGLLLLVSETLVVVMTAVRRPPIIIDRTWQARVVTGASILGIPLIRPIGDALIPDIYTALVSAVGLGLIIVGKLTLGRSFALMPAHRGLVCTGVYGWVRHPIYAGYLITHVAFVIAHPAWWNVVLLVVGDVSLLMRSVYEERTLARDPEYLGYMARVKWRVLPGVL
jgi:protein-S-isoprenylcysteine O-methyltransferase Ste14